MSWRPRPNVIKLQRTNDALAATLTRVRAELEAATRHRTGLKVMLAVREKRIDALSFEIERRKESAGRIKVSLWISSEDWRWLQCQDRHGASAAMRRIIAAHRRQIERPAQRAPQDLTELLEHL